jgi:uncharacterized protein
MSLKVNLRHLEEDGLRLKGELPVAELDLGVADELIHMNQPLRHDFSVELLHDAVLVTGSLVLPLDCECARCLKKFKFDLKLSGWAVHLPLEGEDKVSIDNDCVDLTPFVREDILLNFPQHPLCKTDCAGLKTENQAPQAGGGDQAKPAVWAELDKLKLK